MIKCSNLKICRTGDWSSQSIGAAIPQGSFTFFLSIIIVDLSSAWTAQSKGRSESKLWITSTQKALRYDSSGGFLPEGK